jgi:hypothetical protein
MQAFCPAQSKEQAREIASVLQAIASELDLRLLGMPGTLSWGQHGKMKECLEFH